MKIIIHLGISSFNTKGRGLQNIKNKELIMFLSPLELKEKIQKRIINNNSLNLK